MSVLWRNRELRAVCVGGGLCFSPLQAHAVSLDTDFTYAGEIHVSAAVEVHQQYQFGYMLTLSKLLVARHYCILARKHLLVSQRKPTGGMRQH